MRSMSKPKILTIGLVIGQMLGVGMWLPTHADVDSAVWPGQAKVLEHKDNGPCRDIPLSNSDYCAICSAAQSRVSPTPVQFTFEQQRVVGQIVAVTFVTSSQQLLLDSFSRRGPPSSLLA